MNLSKRLLFIPLSLVVFILAFYWSLPFALSSELSNSIPQEENKLVNDIHQREMALLKESKILLLERGQESEDDGFFESLDVKVGDSILSVIEKYGSPDDEGMYEGGPYYDYGNFTCFTSPDSKKIVAIALIGEELTDTNLSNLDAIINKTPIFQGVNEMDGYWMELYRVNDKLDMMIERHEEESSIEYIWLTERNLFFNE